MKAQAVAGFCEVSHGADAALDVWASDLPELFRQAALGMLALMIAEPDEGTPIRRSLSLAGADNESLLVAFLSHLLFLLEQERLVFSITDLIFRPGKLEASLAGAPLRSIQREIKAVTFNELAIRQADECLKVTIVFDL
jgi:SHS2 domain-containing protein